MRSRVEAAIAAIAHGKPVVVTDDLDRENEGDVVIAADAVDAFIIAFMAVQCRGLVCLAMTGGRLDELSIPPMVCDVRAETNFALSIDLDVPGSTGISASDRARTIRRAVDPAASPTDFRRPGHVFPLRAVDGGLRERRGHTEASVTLATLAGRSPAAVICEILNDDGTMARGADLDRFARKYDLPQLSIAELVDYLSMGCGRRPEAGHWARPPMQVQRVAETTIPTGRARWRAEGFRSGDGLEYVVISVGVVDDGAPVAVRIHSECLTGDVLGSRRCDCGRQLQAAMTYIEELGRGVVVYVKGHEGRGIGILPKLQAYAMQDLGLDTVDANVALGFDVDARSYRGAAEILLSIGLRQVQLLTNNPDKKLALEREGLRVEMLPLVVAPSDDSLVYMETKRRRLGHDLPTVELWCEGLGAGHAPRPQPVACGG